MYNYRFRDFFGWKLLLVMALFAMALQLILMIFDWYYKAEPLVFNGYSLIEFLITYSNLLLVSSAIFKLVIWLNSKLMWSIKTAILRTTLDIVLFSLVTIGWIILENQLIVYLKTGSWLEPRQIIFFIAIGTIINLFLIPLIEFVVLMNLQYQTALNSKQLLHERIRSSGMRFLKIRSIRISCSTA